MDKIAREKLAKIIEAEGDKNWWNPEEFEKHVRSQLPVELKIISVPPSPAGNFNCFVYALGLENDPEFLGGQNPIQKEFIRYLLSRGILEKTENPSARDLVFYEDARGGISHGGIVQSDGSILSKWMWGALFNHDLWDVPSTFGEKIFYCKSIEPRTAKQSYIEYRDSGIEIKPIS